ncbi:MAG: hypothetical protein CMF74_12340 [Maricaulis sp.]|nr:hypothetical protein [Maricaulis sp.]
MQLKKQDLENYNNGSWVKTFLSWVKQVRCKDKFNKHSLMQQDKVIYKESSSLINSMVLFLIF